MANQKLISYQTKDNKGNTFTAYTSCRLLAFKRQNGIGLFEFQLLHQPKIQTS